MQLFKYKGRDKPTNERLIIWKAYLFIGHDDDFDTLLS